jgi:hypothetical protein
MTWFCAPFMRRAVEGCPHRERKRCALTNAWPTKVNTMRLVRGLEKQRASPQQALRFCPTTAATIA